MKVLYIAGYGRCGSTVLSIILSHHSQIIAIGEASFLLDDWADYDRLCSCGMRYAECTFWKDLFSEGFPASELKRLVEKVEGTPFLPCLLLGLVSDEDCQAYRMYGVRLFDYVSSRTGKSIILDSSKSARRTVGRFLALSKLANQDVYVLHLVRSGLATMESLVVTGRNWVIEGYAQAPRWPAIRAAVGWVRANVFTSLLGRCLGSGHYMRLRYEDLIEDPASILRRIGRFCGFDVEGLIGDIDRDYDFHAGHMIGGNRIRLQRKVRLRRDEKQPFGGRLNLHQRFVFVLVGGWLHRYYGYDLPLWL